jgi:hypothetical protein
MKLLLQLAVAGRTATMGALCLVEEMQRGASALQACWQLRQQQQVVWWIRGVPRRECCCSSSSWQLHAHLQQAPLLLLLLEGP